MIAATLAPNDSPVRAGRRLARKAIQSPALMTYAAFQRHRLRVLRRNQSRWHGEPNPSAMIELTDDVFLFDKHGRRILPPAYATLPIDQLPRFQKK